MRKISVYRPCLIGAAISSLVMPVMAYGQSVPIQSVPLSDADCFGMGRNPFIGQTCIVDGIRTTTPTTGTATLESGQVRANGQWQVNFNGNLKIDALPFSTVPGQSFVFDATDFYSPDVLAVHVTSSYTGQLNNILLPNTFDVNNVGLFQQYSGRADTINSINVAVEDGNAYDAVADTEYVYTLNTPNPTAITGGNTVAVVGTYAEDNEEETAIVFGTLSGTAQVRTTAGVVPATQLPGSNGAWFSSYGLNVAVTPVETTRLDATGLKTPAITVTNGIDMNGSRITEVGAAVAGTDAVNLNQLNARTQYAAFNSAGAAAVASGASSIALGGDAQATSFETTALGARAVSASGNSFAAGAGAQATGQASLAFGSNSTASGGSATAIGGGALATGTFSTAVGRSSAAVHDASTALGYAAVTTRANQIRLGTADTNYSMPGLLTSSDAAQTGTEFFVTVDANGTLGKGAQSSAALTQMGSQISSLQAGQALIDDQVGQLFDLRALDRKQTQRGIAAAMAMADAPFPSAPGKTSYAAKSGVYRGEVAFSASLSHRLNTQSPFALTASVSHSGGKDTGFSAGLAGEF